MNPGTVVSASTTSVHALANPLRCDARMPRIADYVILDFSMHDLSPVVAASFRPPHSVMLRPRSIRPLSRGLSQASSSLTRSAVCTSRRGLATAVAEEKVSLRFSTEEYDHALTSAGPCRARRDNNSPKWHPCRDRGPPGALLWNRSLRRRRLEVRERCAAGREPHHRSVGVQVNGVNIRRSGHRKD